jgi:hypothetical protein
VLPSHIPRLYGKSIFTDAPFIGGNERSSIERMARRRAILAHMTEIRLNVNTIKNLVVGQFELHFNFNGSLLTQAISYLHSKQ